jgi:hypothetical protein
VLEIHVPQVQGKDTSAALAHSLLAMAPKFLTYILSFVLVCIWWVAHHHLFHVLKRSDRGLLWLNSLFLLWLAFIPFFIPLPYCWLSSIHGFRLLLHHSPADVLHSEQAGEIRTLGVDRITIVANFA